MSASQTDTRLVRRLLGFVWPHWRLLTLSVLLLVALTALEIAVPYILADTVDGHIAAGQRGGLLTMAALFAIAVVGRGVLSMALGLALLLLGERALHDLRCRLHSHALTRSAAFFDRTPVGRVLTNITADVESLIALFTSGVITSLADVLILLAVLGAMFYLSVELTLVSLAAAVLLIPLFRWVRTAIRTRTRDMRARFADFATFAMERLSGVSVVQLLGRESTVAREYAERNDVFRGAAVASARATVLSQPVTETVATIAAAFVLWYSGASGTTVASVGLVIAFIEYSNRLFAPLYTLAQKFGVLQGALAALERIFGLLDDTDADAPARETTAAKAGDTNGPAIEFRDVQFGYGNRDRVLHGISLVIPRGATVAVVGATGSGKSTLVKLLARHYQAQAGDILLDGRDVRDIPVAELRRRMTLIAQDVFLFAGTIADNVRLGRPDATAKDVDEALARVGLLGRKPADTKLVERGANLSHGERQLVAFARALVRDPEILLLDEATAHVDPETEQLIEKALATMFSGRTSLIIAHRLATIRRADHIIVMSKGVIVEWGTRDELLARGGAYAQLEATGSLAAPAQS